METCYAYLLDNRDGVVEYAYEATRPTYGEARSVTMNRAIEIAQRRNQYEEDMRFVPISHGLATRLGLHERNPWPPKVL